MGVRLYTELTSSLGIDYRIRVYDDSYASTAIEVTCNDFELTYEPSDDSLLCPIISSHLKFEIYDDGTSGIDTAITSIETSDEANIKVTLERDTGSGYSLEWIGIIQKDIIWRENNAEPTKITLTATDGLNLLKDIRYPGIANGTHTGSSQLAQFIVECLDELDLSGFWGASEPYLRESIEWSENSLVSPGSDSPLLYTRCDVLKFRDDPSSPETTNKTCFECLEAILQLFGAQMLLSNGAYYIRQPRNYDSTTHTERRISKGLSELSSASVSNDTTTIAATSTPSTDQVRVLGGGQFGNREALDIVRAVVKPGYLLPTEAQGTKKIDNSTKNQTYTIPLGTVFGGSGSGNYIEFRQKFKLPKGRWEIKFTVTIQLPGGTAYYLTYTAATNTFGWSTSPVGYIHYYKPDYRKDDYIVYFTTEELPVSSSTSAELTSRFEFWDRTTSAQPTNVGGQQAWAFPPDVVMRNEDDIVENFEVEIDNTVSSDNSAVLDLGDVWFNDNAIISTKNLFEVNTTGSTWAVSDTWDAGYDTDKALWLTMLYERMSYQQDPVKMYRGAIEGYYRPHLQWIYSADSFVMRRLTHRGRMDEFEGDWWELNQALNSITIGDERLTDFPSDIPRTKKPDTTRDDNDRFYKLSRLGEVGTNYDEGDTITQINLISQIGIDLLKDGDPVIVVHPVTGEIMQEFECDTDSTTTDTSISVTSETADYDMDIGYPILTKEWVLKASELIRMNAGQFNKQLSNSAASGRSMFESSDSGQLSYKDVNDNIMPLGEMVATKLLSSADITTLNTTPIEIVGTPGSGYYIEPQRIIITYTYDTAAYTGVDGSIEVKYASSSTRVAVLTTNPFKEGTSQDVQMVVEPAYHASGLTDLSNLDNNALHISHTQARATGAGTATVVVYYKVIAI